MDAGCRHRMKGQGVGCGGCSARRRSQRGLGKLLVVRRLVG